MRILVVEDDPGLRALLSEALGKAGHSVASAPDAESALKKLARVDFLLTDLRLPGMDGLGLLQKARAENPKLQVTVMTAYGTIPSAVAAMRMGARNYITKPFDWEELLLHLKEAEETLIFRRAADRAGRVGLAGTSATMQRIYREIDMAAISSAPVLITGETGTGKGLAAQAIHALSIRRKRPFVAVDLGAVSHALLPSELFGHERGAFTDAREAKRGRLALASGGTLFLDEIEVLPLDLQPKLLRFLETGEVWPLGAERPVTVEARVIAATNADLSGMVAEGRFRQDLFYRLNVLPILMPPLREHPEDIPVIGRTLLDRLAERAPGETEAGEPPEAAAVEISGRALAALMTRTWEGNVRELANTIEKAVAACAALGESPAVIREEHLGLPATGLPTLPFKEAKAQAADEWTKRTIGAALAVSGGNVSSAAKLLKMNTSALFRLLQRYNIEH